MKPRLEGTTILVVDDDPDVLESMSTALEVEGAEVATAQDGNEAVRLAREEKPDLVVLDVMLPRRSGFLALERIKGNEDSPLVIMVTANEGKRHEAYAVTLGVDAYLQKPVPLAVLVQTAADLIHRRNEEAPAAGPA